MKTKLNDKYKKMKSLIDNAQHELYQFDFNKTITPASDLLPFKNKIPFLSKLVNATESVKIHNIGGMPILSIKFKKDYYEN